MTTPPPVLSKPTRIERPDDEVAAYLSRTHIADRLTPPWYPAIAQNPNASFDDRILATHIEPSGEAACLLTEELRGPTTPSTSPFLTAAPSASAPALTPAQLDRLLAYRHATIRDDVEHTAAYGNVRPLRIAIAGANGLIGRALTTFLKAQKHEVIPLARAASGTYDHARLDKALHNTDAVINLAGASIAAQPWTQTRRDIIWESRVNSTRALITAIEKLKHRPYVFLNASAVGYYGTRGDDLLDETAPRPPTGASFLSDVCAGIEHETTATENLGLRATMLRFGLVLSPAGGALAAMIPFFQKNLGGKLGHGRQWTSWISIDDAVAAIYHALLTHPCTGPINISSPTPVTNADFTAALSHALNKKSRTPVPRWLLRFRYGIDFANETLLASQRLDPAKLRATGYTFRHPTLESALAHLLP